MRKALAMAVLVCGLVWPSGADAAPILQVNGSGILTGALGIDVGGTFYDVTFIDGTCPSVFAPCTAPSNGFDFSSLATATAAAQALDTQVFTGAYDTTPNLTFGCSHIDSCLVVVPYLVAGGLVNVVYFRNDSGASTDFVANGALFPTSDLSTEPHVVYADFTPSAVTPVPEPASLLLLGSGLAGAAIKARRRRKQPNA